MILPIGSHCGVAEALVKNNLRKCSYPFDWIDASLDSVCRILLLILSDINIADFCDTFFDVDKNKLLFLKYAQNYYFFNIEYGIGFPHDDLKTIKDKYIRRFSRLREHFFAADKVTLIYSSRWTYHDDKLYSLLEDLYKLRSNIELITVNALKFPTKLDYVKALFVPYPDEHIIQCQQHNWTYDNVYKQDLVNILKNNM